MNFTCWLEIRECKKGENKDILKLTSFHFNHHSRWSSKEMYSFRNISNFFLFASRGQTYMNKKKPCMCVEKNKQNGMETNN